MTSWKAWLWCSQSRAISRSWRPSWLICTSRSVARWKRRSARSSSARSSSVILSVAIPVARLSSSARTMNASRISSRESMRTRTPRFGSKVTSPSAARRLSASRTGVRLTWNCSERCSWRSVLPGGISPETIASSSANAMSSAFVPSDTAAPRLVHRVAEQLRVGREREELDEDLPQRDALEHLSRVLVHGLVRQLRHHLVDDPLDLGALDPSVPDPLPDLRAGDLGGRSVLHEVVDGRGPDALEPGSDVADSHGDVRPDAGLGDLAGRRGDVHQVGCPRRHVLAEPLDLVRPLAENGVELGHRRRHEVRMRDPGSVEAVAGLARLVLANARQGDLVHLGVAAARDECGHAADRMRSTPVARPHEQLRVGAHEGDGHRHQGPIRKHELRPLAELLDHREDVVPAARVQPRGVLAELVQDLLHLEGGEDRLDEDGRLDRPARNPGPVLREAEDLVPEPRLEVALELREVEVGPSAALEQALDVPLEVDAEVEEARRDVLSVELDVTLLQMPAPGPHEEDGDLVLQLVALLALLERDRPFDRVAEVLLAADDVLPRRRVRVLEVGHVDACPRVEGIDDHLPVTRRPGDLDAPVLEIVRYGSNAPVALANGARRLEEVGKLARLDALLPLGTRAKKLLPATGELALERDDELERLGREDAGLVRCGDDYFRDDAHATRAASN